MRSLRVCAVVCLAGCFPFYSCPEHTGMRDRTSVPADAFEAALSEDGQLSDAACRDLCADYVVGTVDAVTDCSVEDQPADTGDEAVLVCVWDGTGACG